MPPNDGTLLMEDATILFPNFAGKEGMYNAEGDRNFCVLLTPELADQMDKDGWNVKQLKPREEGGEGNFYIQVSLKYRGRGGKVLRPPRMVLISSRGRVDLGEHECEILDWVDIKKVDLIVRPNHWEVNGKSGLKAYLKSIFVTMHEDYLELKYNDVPYAQVAGSEPRLAIEAGRGQSPAVEGTDDDIVDAELVD